MRRRVILLVLFVIGVLIGMVLLKITGIDDRYVVGDRTFIISNGFLLDDNTEWEQWLVKNQGEYELHSKSLVEPLSSVGPVRFGISGMYQGRYLFKRDWLYVWGYFDVD